MFNTLQYSNLDHIIFEGPPKPASGLRISRRGRPSANQALIHDIPYIPELEHTARSHESGGDNTGDGELMNGQQVSVHDLFDLSDDDAAASPNNLFTPKEHHEEERTSDTNLDSVSDRASNDVQPRFPSGFDSSGQGGCHGDTTSPVNAERDARITESPTPPSRKSTQECDRHEPKGSLLQSGGLSTCGDVEDEMHDPMALTDKIYLFDRRDDLLDVRDDDFLLFEPLEENDFGNDIGEIFATDCFNGLSPGRRNDVDEAVSTAVRARERSCAFPPEPIPSTGSNKEGNDEEERLSYNHHNGEKANYNGDGNIRAEDDSSTVNEAGGEDYANGSNIINSETEERRHRKKVRRSNKMIEHSGNMISSGSEKTSLANGTDGPDGDMGAVSFCVTKESGAIFIHGFLPPNALESKIVFSFTISQDPCSQSLKTAHKHDDMHRLRGEPASLHTNAPGRLGKRSPFSPEEDALLVRLKKEESLLWDDIAKYFPGRTKGALQVRYSTKLNSHRKQQRPGRKRGCPDEEQM